MSLSLWVCLQRQGNHKTMKCFFSFPPTHFSFDGAFLAHWAGGGGGGGGSRRRLMERATWTNPVWNQDSQAQPDLWLSTPLFPHRGPSLELLDVLDPVYYFLSPLSTSLPSPFPVPHSHSSFLCPSIFSLDFSIWYLFLFLSPSFASRHPGQLFIQTGCLQLSVQSWVAVQEVGCVAHGAKLFPNTSVSSRQRPWPKHDLDTTTTAKPPTHTAWR